MQTYKHFTLFTLVCCCLFCSSGRLYAQDIPIKGQTNIPARKTGDTLPHPPTPTLDERPEKIADTVKTDSLAAPKETLTDVVDYYAEDHVYINRKTNRVHLYNKAYIVYGDMRIDAGYIILDHNTNEVYAKGLDSAGVYAQKPVFKQAQNEVRPDSIRFNFDTEKALVYNSATEQSGFNVLAKVTKKVNDSVVYLQNVRFTTAQDLNDPEYYFYTRRAKFVPKKKIVTGLTNMYIYDVPTPIGLPFAYFPLTEDRTSGFIIPTVGEDSNRGFFFQNGGYYFAISDYVDLTLTGDYYTNGSYGLRAESAYALRYRFRGNVSLRYENLIQSERGFPNFSQSEVYNIRWNHGQDAKANPSSRFSASVNLGSSRYFQQSINQINNASGLVNTLSSSVSYSKTLPTEPEINYTVAATHSQNTNTQQITMSLPNVNGNVSRVFPFAPKVGAKKGVVDNINLQYSVQAQNRVITTDSLFFKPEMFDNLVWGARHSVPLSTNFKVLGYLSASASANYTETWVGNTTRQRFDPSAGAGAGAVVTDTVRGFDAFRTYSFGSSLGTTVYGTFNFGGAKKIQAIRHVIRPSVSFGVTPGFGQYYEDLVIPSADPEVNDEVRRYSRFERSLFGAPNQNFSSSLGFSLSNTLEAKVAPRDTTVTEPKKVTLLRNFNLSSSYNLAGDSLRFNPVGFTGGIPIVEKLDLNFNGSLDPYALDNNNRRIGVFNIKNGGSLFRLTNANISMNYSFSSRDFEGDRKDTNRLDNETFRNGGRPDDLFGDALGGFEDPAYQTKEANKKKGPKQAAWYNYKIPWNLRLAYTITYNNAQRQDEISSQSLMASSNLELSPRWTVGVSSGYDFKNKGVTLTQLRFERDLESWQMRFTWTPIGARNTSWYFFIGIRGVLSDIKYDKRRTPDRDL